MKIVFTGGGTGGHFYPLVAVAEAVGRYALRQQLVEPKMYYFGPTKFNEKALYNAGIRFVRSFAGKMRRTTDLQSRVLNAFSLIPLAIGTLQSLFAMFIIFPDVVFSKGGYTSVPVTLAARILRIPIVVHESDAAFGRANSWAKSFARFIAISYPEAERELSEEERARSALIGVPIRRDLDHNPLPNAHEVLRLDPEVPTVVVLGGSQGARFVNQNVIDALPVLLKEYQVVHIAGQANVERLQKETASFLKGMQGLKTYHLFGTLNAYNLRALYSVADVVVSRAGSGTIFELAQWELPVILIPIREEVSHDQRKNAYAYARATGATVLEEQNLSPNLLANQITNFITDKQLRSRYVEQAKEFAKPEAAEKVAELLVTILKSHEV